MVPVHLILLSLACSAHASSLSSRSSNYSSLRIHNGISIDQDEYPYVVIIADVDLSGGSVHRICTSFMITAEWGITAGHCVSRKLPNIYIWYSNFTNSPLSTNLYIKVAETFRHPSARILTLNREKTDHILDNDIGLIQAEKEIKLKSYARLSSVDRSSLMGLPVVYIGGGATGKQYNSLDEIEQLKMGEAVVIACDMEMTRISKYAICIAPKCSNRLQTPWFGDSGGPLISDSQVIGVGSYGKMNGLYPRIAYAPISPYIDWICTLVKNKN